MNPPLYKSDRMEPCRSKSWSLSIRLTIAGLFIGGILAVTSQFGTEEILNYLVTWETHAESYRNTHPVAVYTIAFLLYVLVTGLSLPGAAALTIVYGWFFEFAPALILVSFASTSGATLAFLMSRYLLRETIQERFGSRLQSLNEVLEKEGATYLFTLRLIPAVPFFILNLLMGLTPIRAHTFWWISQLGMLPGTAVFTYAGHSFPDLGAIQKAVNEHGFSGLLTDSGSEINLANLLAALILLGLFPVALKFVMKRFRKATVPPDDDQSGEQLTSNS